MKYVLIIIFAGLLSDSAIAQWTEYPITGLTYNCSTIPQWADLDQDGLVDILCYDEDNQSVFWQRNLDGSFAEATPIGEGLILHNKIFKALDIDRDGDLDILAQLETNNSNILWNEYINKGSGSFTLSQESFVSETHLGEIIGYQDLDGDGDRDLVLERWEAIDIYTNNNGVFEFSDRQIVPGSAPIYCLDWNMDGKYEVAYRDNNQVIHMYSIVENALLEILTFGGWTDDHIDRFTHFVDYDDDGDLDMLEAVQLTRLVTNGDVGNLEYKETRCLAYENKGSEIISHSVYTSNSNSDGPPYHSVGDLNGDGTIEWAIFDNNYKLFALDSDMIYQIEEESTLTLPFGHTRDSQIIPSGLSGRGLMTSYVKQNSGIGIIPLDDSARWGPCSNCQGIGDFSKQFHSADIDSDGDLDLLTASLENQFQIAWLENDGNCNFSSQELIGSPFDPALVNSLDIAPGDFDNDGDLDIAIKENYEKAVIKLYFNLDGKGNYGNEVIIDSIDWITQMYVEDLDQDGTDEIILRQGKISSIQDYPEYHRAYVYRNVANTAAMTIETLNTQSTKGEVKFGDLDKDGDLDIVANNSTPWKPHIGIHINDGDQFSSNETYQLPFAAITGQDVFDVMDVDGDGAPDLITHQRADDYTLFVYYNTDGAFDYDNPEPFYSDADPFHVQGILLDNQSPGFLVSESFAGRGPWYTRIVEIDQSITELSGEEHQRAQALHISGNDYHDILLGRDNLSFYSQNKLVSSIDNIEASPLTLFPNPTHDYLQLPNQNHSRVSIYSVDGRLELRSTITNSDRINVSDLSPGVYIMQAQHPDQGVQLGRFVKM